MVILGEVQLISGIVTAIEFRDKQNIVSIKLKHFDGKGEKKEKNLDINKEMFDEKLENLVLDCECFIGVRRNNLKIVEKFDESYDPSNYDKITAKAWYIYKKEHLKGYNRYLKDDVIFIKQITNENGEEMENSYASNENLDLDYINNLYKCFVRLNSDAIKSISKSKV